MLISVNYACAEEEGHIIILFPLSSLFLSLFIISSLILVIYERTYLLLMKNSSITYKIFKTGRAAKGRETILRARKEQPFISHVSVKPSSPLLLL